MDNIIDDFVIPMLIILFMFLASTVLICGSTSVYEKEQQMAIECLTSER